MTVSDALQLAERELAAAGVDTPRVDAELLVKVGPECVEHARIALAALTEMASWGEAPTDEET